MELGYQVVLTLVVVALVAGWVDAVVGGGGLIQLPGLLLTLPPDTPVPVISGTNKVSSVAGTAVATLTLLRQVRVRWRPALALVISAYAGSSAGARAVAFVPKAWFTTIVLVVLIAVGIYTVRRPQLGLTHAPRHHGVAEVTRLVLIGVVIGFYDGFLGPGTGSFFVIALVGMLGYGFLDASAMAKLANLTTNVAAIAVFAAHGQVWWRLGLVMAVGNLVGGLIGARMALRGGNRFVRRVFLVVIAVLTVRLGYEAVISLRDYLAPGGR